MSLDGLFAGTNDQVAPFLDRRQNGNTEVTRGAGSGGRSEAVTVWSGWSSINLTVTLSYLAGWDSFRRSGPTQRRRAVSRSICDSFSGLRMA